MTSRSRNWSIEEEFDSDYSYPKLPRYSNVNTTYYMTPQRYVGSVSDTYSPTVRQSTRMVNLPTVTSHLHGKSYTRAIPAIAHQRLSGTSLPPRSYVSTYDSDDKLLGYRVPPSNHVITATTYRPWPEEEIEYYQPRVYTDSWAHTITPPNRIRWRSYIDDDDYTVEDPVFVRSGSQYKNTPLPRANFSYADRYANDIYNDSTSIVPSSYYLGHKSHVPVHVNKGYHYMMPKYKSIDPRDYYEDSSHARKYVVVPMRDVHSDIYNMSFYRKPMEAANIGAGHLACLRFAGSRYMIPNRPQKSYGLDTIPREVDTKSLYGGMIAAVRDHRLVRVSIYPINWKDDEGSIKKDRVIEISTEPVRPWKFMGARKIRREPRIVELKDPWSEAPKVPRTRKTKEESEEKVTLPPPPKKSSPPPKEPTPPPPKEPTPPPPKEPTPPPPKEPTPPPVKTEPETKKKKRSKGAAAEVPKAETPKEEPKPEPPKEEPKPEPPKEETKPELPKEEPKPEPPKEEPKPEPPKEEPKPEPPQEESKEEKPTEEPKVEQPKPEEPAPAPEETKEEPKTEVKPEEEDIPEPETPVAAAVRRKSAFEEDPSWLQAASEGEAKKEEPIMESPIIPNQHSTEEPKPQAEEPITEDVPEEEPVVDPIKVAAERRKSVFDEDTDWLKGGEEETNNIEEAPVPETPGTKAVRRKGAFDEDPGWLDATEEEPEAPAEEASVPETPAEETTVPETPGTKAVRRKGAFDEEPGWLDEGDTEPEAPVPETPVPETPGTKAARRKGAFDEDSSWLDEETEGDAGTNVSIVVADPEGGNVNSAGSQQATEVPVTDGTSSPSDARVAQIQEN